MRVWRAGAVLRNNGWETYRRGAVWAYILIAYPLLRSATHGREDRHIALSQLI